MLEKKLETAIELAKIAGEVILEFYALEIIAEEKYGVDNFSEPVTIADRTASKIIVEGLPKRFPTTGFCRKKKPTTSKPDSKANVSGSLTRSTEHADLSTKTAILPCRSVWLKKAKRFSAWFSASSEKIFITQVKGNGAFVIEDENRRTV